MFLKNKKVVVTGGSGMIGTQYISQLLKLGAKVKTHTHINKLNIKDEEIEVLENIDLEKFDDAKKLIDGADYVIHSAGKIAHPSAVPTDFQVALNQIVCQTNVLEAAHKAGVKGYLDINSSTGYPDRRYPVTENEYWDDEPFISYYGYGWNRRYREKVMEHLSHFSDMKIALCRGTSMFGPHDNFNLKTCHVIPALIKRVLSNEDPLIVWGTPEIVRDVLYSKDVAKGALLVLEKGESMRPYNLGSGTAVTVGDMLNAILKATKKNPKIEWDNSKPTTIPFRMVSTERITNELGFKPDYTFEEGIEETVEWYISNKS